MEQNELENYSLSRLTTNCRKYLTILKGGKRELSRKVLLCGPKKLKLRITVERPSLFGFF